MPAPRTIKSALAALDGMRTIVLNDMLTHNQYVSSGVEAPERAKSVCRGHKACAVGSLFLAGGAPMPLLNARVPAAGYHMPVAYEHNRLDYLARRAGLKLAYNAMNEAAQGYSDDNQLDDVAEGVNADGYRDAMERLFEVHHPDSAVMLGIIAQARDAVMRPRKDPRPVVSRATFVAAIAEGIDAAGSGLTTEERALLAKVGAEAKTAAIARFRVFDPVAGADCGCPLTQAKLAYSGPSSFMFAYDAAMRTAVPSGSIVRIKG